MREFLECYADSRDASSSLRSAQIARIEHLRKKYGFAAPFYWAGFISSKR
jgi:CHAT domain-containing protein